MLSITVKSIGAINEEMQEIPIAEARLAELPVELRQLLSAARALRPAHDFDRDPVDFQRLLHALRE